MGGDVEPGPRSMCSAGLRWITGLWGQPERRRARCQKPRAGARRGVLATSRGSS